MKKLFVKLCMLLMVLFLLSGCAKQSSPPMARIQKQLTELSSYECTATLTRISNKGENTYETKQYFKSTGEYRLELLSPESVSGNYTVFDGKTVCQFNPRIGGRVLADVAADKGRNQLFLGEFIKNYLLSEGVSIASASLDETQCTVLEAIVPGNEKYLAAEKLWVDNKTLNPLKYVIYDNEGKERYIVEYESFTYNPKLDDSLFSIPKS